MRNTSNSLFLIILSSFLFITSILLFFIGPEMIQQRLSIFSGKNNGEVGNSFSGILTPVISWIAALLTFAAFYVQYKANIQQNEAIKVQRFEDTFFRLLENHQKIVELIDIRETKDPTRILSIGRDSFKRIYRNFVAKVAEQKVATNDINAVLSVYDSIQNHYKSDLHHYFRFLYHIIKFIKTSDIPPASKFKYTAILRASLSAYEMVLVFYNCLHNNGKEQFKPLLTEFSMLKNLDATLLIDSSHYYEYDYLAYASSTERDEIQNGD